MYDYQLIRSSRKSITMEITNDLEVLVRAPQRMSRREIDRYVEYWDQWITETMEKRRIWLQTHPQPQEEDIPRLREEAREYFTRQVEHYSAIMGLHPTGIKITSGQKRLGSCNWKGGLCFSWRNMLYPEEAREYLVVHELAHLRHMDHSKSFYALVEQYMPDWKERRKSFYK